MTLKSGKAYVWVLASVREVIYILRPNREGAFLHDVLREFTGVLVSDFYGAYDSLPCLQQKCLVHFIRDINADLIKNPFDEEFRRFAMRFSALLQGIVKTIDRHGLKRRFLYRHHRETDAFISDINTHPSSSEIVEGYRGRIKRYGDRMFTFLDHDGVPWNNAHAEHAVRRFANYRRKTDGFHTAEGLESHLTLLSLFQTCEYRDLEFLEVMLSKETSLSNIHTAARRKVLRPTLDVLPQEMSVMYRGGGRPVSMRRSIDPSIRIPYLNNHGKSVEEIMAELNVSRAAVVRAITKAAVSHRSKRQ